MKHQRPFMFLGRSGRLYAEVRLHDLQTGEVRTVNHRDECEAETDRAAYDECVSRGEVITMGHTIAEPINKGEPQ